MYKSKSPVWLVNLTILALGVATLTADPKERIWTNNKGSKITAQMVAIDGNTIRLLSRSNGRTVPVPLNSLSAEDQAYVAEWRELGFGTKVARWPRELRPMLNFTPRQTDSAKGWVYTTPNYQFHCDVELQASLIKEYSEAFEATYFAIQNLPLQLNPEPPDGKFVVRLFEDRDDYLRAGGPQGSGGVYMIQSKEIMVPMQSLGVRSVGNRVAIDRRNYDSGTLVHEITHQVMHNWLDLLPIWFVEGIAEYMAAVPYDDARFNFREIHDGVREHLANEYGIEKTRGDQYFVDIISPEALMSLSHQQWSAAVSSGRNAALNYRSAMMLIYYFIHLDGKGDGSPMVAYLKQARSGQDDLKEFVAQYNEAVNTYNAQLRQYNLDVSTFNEKLTRFRQEVASYNERIKTYNRQLSERVPESELIKVEPKPGKVPSPPEKPVLPQILIDNPDGGGPVDLMLAEKNARRALFKKRSANELWSDMEKAFAKQNIRIQRIGGMASLPKIGGTLRARPIQR
tara:strand:- start:6208 stop:7743 length:1536 start_codon:yes stop_codon:yes gene_type:complete